MSLSKYLDLRVYVSDLFVYCQMFLLVCSFFLCPLCSFFQPPFLCVSAFNILLPISHFLFSFSLQDYILSISLSILFTLDTFFFFPIRISIYLFLPLFFPSHDTVFQLKIM